VDRGDLAEFRITTESPGYCGKEKAGAGKGLSHQTGFLGKKSSWDEGGGGQFSPVEGFTGGTDI